MGGIAFLGSVSRHNVKELQEKLGYAFVDEGLLELALTAPAYRMDHPHARDNQRLEFLGDAVFGLYSADSLFRKHPDDNEGALTVRRTRLASGAALAAAAESLGIRRLLRRNKGADPLPERSKALADAMEAVLGAVWLDGGEKAVRKVYDRLWPDTGGDFDEWGGNPKGRLQTIAQAMRPPRKPVYETLEVTGPAHAPHVRTKVCVEGLGEAEGEGSSHRAAETAAATELLKVIAGLKFKV